MGIFEKVNAQRGRKSWVVLVEQRLKYLFIENIM
jgi:hypothetical protein